jgi:26S proteasome regulatory subunit N2
VGNDKVLQVSEKNVHHLVAMVQCYILLADGVSLGNVMNILAKGNPYQQLLSFQIAFDLEETHDQKLTNDVVSNLIADPEYRDGG